MYQDILNSFLPELQKKYVLEHDSKASNDKGIVLRSTISSATEAESFIKDFSEASDSQWIVYRSNKACYSKIAYHKSWICQHSSYRKKSLSKRNLKCSAKISISVKKITEHTKKKDPFLSAVIPLCGKISIDFNHSHDLHNANILKMRRVSEQVKQQFSSYFDDGLNPKTAKRHHESMLLASDSYLTDTANAAKNPTDRQVYQMHDMWCKLNLGPAGNPCEKLLQKKQLYEEKELP